MTECSTYCFTSNHELNEFSFFDIGKEKTYLKPQAESFSKTFIAKELAKKSTLKINCYFAGDYLAEQTNEDIKLIKNLLGNGQIELLAGTYHHSLSCLFSSTLFKEEVENHLQILMQIFKIKPKGFYNTLAIFSNELASLLVEFKMSFCIVPALDWYLHDIDQITVNSVDPKLKLLVQSPSIDASTISRVFHGNAVEPIQLETSLASDLFKKGNKQHTYLLPKVAGIDPDNHDLDYFLGNALQEQVFEMIQRITPDLEKSSKEVLKKDLLQLSNPLFFSLLDKGNPERLTIYSRLMSMLSDLELKVA